MDVTEDEHARMIDEVLALMAAWKDRHPEVDTFLAAGIFLQAGAVGAKGGGASLEQTVQMLVDAYEALP